jgi:hypothetical protein
MFSNHKWAYLKLKPNGPISLISTATFCNVISLNTLARVQNHNVNINRKQHAAKLQTYANLNFVNATIKWPVFVHYWDLAIRLSGKPQIKVPIFNTERWEDFCLQTLHVYRCDTKNFEFAPERVEHFRISQFLIFFIMHRISV